ncbi:hypothetical protein [Paenibacillus residui]|uniref:Uncharacterized protein n=1 Tax=Paenibacillus residui TaxID=629724 RepID=A0ABW3D7D2_9BACL
MLAAKIRICAFLFIVILLGGGILNQSVESRHSPDSPLPYTGARYQIFSHDSQITGLEAERVPPFKPREYVRIVRQAGGPS